jgi:acylglycerol lipase
VHSPGVPPEWHTWTLRDGYALRGRIWPPPATAPPLGFIYLHGIQSHGGWFEWSASVLAASGYAVILPDRRGSGLNTVARGDVSALECWLTDIDELADWAAREFGIERFGVVGVSWGGKPAVAWALRRPGRVARLLLIAPGLFPAVDLTPWSKLRVGWSLLRGGQALFDIPLNDPALFTDDPAGRRFIADDPLKLTQVTARFLRCSRQLDWALRRAARGALAAPVTLALAGRERIIRNEPTEQWVRRAALRPPDVTVFANAAHTLEFESEIGGLGDLLRSWASAPG